MANPSPPPRGPARKRRARGRLAAHSGPQNGQGEAGAQPPEPDQSLPEAVQVQPTRPDQPEPAPTPEQPEAPLDAAPEAAPEPRPEPEFAPLQPDAPSDVDLGDSGNGGSDENTSDSKGNDMLIINFYDLSERETAARSRNRDDWQVLENRRTKAGNSGGALGAEDQKEYDRLGPLDKLAQTDRLHFLDPLFASARNLLASKQFGLTPIAFQYAYSRPPARPRAVLEFSDLSSPTDAQIMSETARIGLTLGLLQVWDATPPRLIVDNESGNAVPDVRHRNYSGFGEALVRAMARVTAHLPLAVRVLETMADAVAKGEPATADVTTIDFAKTFEKMFEQRVSPDDPDAKMRIEDAFERIKRIGSDTPLHEFVLNLPDLEAATDIEVIPEHCKLMGSFIFASAFEELKAFQVVDKLIELSQRGEIPLMRGRAGTQLYNYWREAPNRMSEVERQNFYAMTLGLPTGQPGIAVNSDFQDLWLRFVSSVSTLVRESRVENLLRSNIPLAVNQQQVKKAARDLAHNMSSRGYGMAFYAAADLNKQINEIIELLSDRELQRVFGATSAYDVIEQVSQTELGGARNSSKYRMLATSGAIITNWIADNAARLRDPTMPMIDLQSVAYPPARASGATAVSNPTDYDLVNACEMWLADSAMGDDRVQMLSEPRESPQTSSRPIQIPSIARDLLEGTGLGLGMGMGYGGGQYGAPPQPQRANGRHYGAY